MSSEITVQVPSETVSLAKSTLPEGVALEAWILTWLKFGLEISGMSSARKEALDIGTNIEKAAARKFATIAKSWFDVFEERIEALENLTNINDQEAGFGRLFKDLKEYADPNNTNSIIYKYMELLSNVDDENGLFRMAVRAELSKDGGVKEKLGSIQKELNIESGKQQIRRNTALKGGRFEDTLVSVLNELVGSNDIMFNKTSNTIGVLPKGAGHNKKGDILLRFGKQHILHGNPIIVEAKDDASFFPVNPKNPQKSAEHYLAKAMENRECSVGIWVHNKATAKHFDRDFSVQGNMLFVVWDADDPSTDWLLLAAMYIAIGRIRISSDDLDEEERIAISNLVTNLKDEVDRFGRMGKFIDIIKTNAKHLDKEIVVGAKRISEILDDAEELMKNAKGDFEDPDLEFEDSDATAAGEEGVDDDSGP